jgi:hypothetical protein
MLFDRGADPKLTDGEGKTMIARAAAAEIELNDALRLLIAKGVDVNARDKAGETALDVARRHGRTTTVDVLKSAGAAAGNRSAAPTATPAPAASARVALERSLPLLQRTDAVFLKKSGCVSCHNNTLTAMTVAAVRPLGIAVDEATARASLKTIGTFIDAWRDRALQGVGIPGDADTVSYILLGLHAEKYAADPATDAMAFFLKRTQLANGQWRILAHRPPLESSDIQVTAASMRALQLYAPAVAKAEFEQGRAARGCLARDRAHARSNEDRAFKLLGLTWGRAGGGAIQKAGSGAHCRAAARWRMGAVAVNGQRCLRDGGRRSSRSPRAVRSPRGPNLPARRAVPVEDPMRGRLVAGQDTRAAVAAAVRHRFPHGNDGWISAAATNWAAMALARGYVKPS